VHEATQKLANAKAESRRKLEEKRQQHDDELKHLDDILVKPAPAPPPPPTAAEKAAAIHAEAAAHDQLHEAELRKLDTERHERLHRVLFQACREGNAAGVEAAFKAGAQINYTASDGTPAMVEAAKGGAESVKIINLLQSRGASLDKPCRRGETPIYTALKNENLSGLQELFKLGAKSFGQNKHGNQAISLALGNDNPEYCKAMIKAGATLTPGMLDGLKKKAETLPAFKEVVALVEAPAPKQAAKLSEL